MDELEQLVARAQARDVEAYGVIVRRFQDMAYGYGCSLLGDFHLAQDAAQEAFIEAYHVLPKLRDPAAFPGWFRRIVFKHCDRLTRGKRVPIAALDAALDVVSAKPDPVRAIEANEIRNKVLEAIQALPERERTATALFYINGYSQQEVAAFLDVPVSTVKDRLYSARTRLKKRMMDMIKDTIMKPRLSRSAEVHRPNRK